MAEKIDKICKEKLNLYSKQDIQVGKLFNGESGLELIIGNWGAGIRTILRGGDSENIRSFIYDVYSNEDLDDEYKEYRDKVSVYPNSHNSPALTSSDPRYNDYRRKLEEAGKW